MNKKKVQQVRERRARFVLLGFYGFLIACNALLFALLILVTGLSGSCLAGILAVGTFVSMYHFISVSNTLIAKIEEDRRK